MSPGASFNLVATGANAPAQDLDNVFHKVLTPCEQAAQTSAVQHENGFGNEAGKVPLDATVAIVNLFVGAAATFTYTEA